MKISRCIIPYNSEMPDSVNRDINKVNRWSLGVLHANLQKVHDMSSQSLPDKAIADALNISLASLCYLYIVDSRFIDAGSHGLKTKIN